MARPLIPFVQNGYYASRNWIPLVKGNGFTTSGGGEQEEVWETASGSVVTFDAVASPLRQLSVAVEPVQNLNGYDSPWPAGGGKNLLDSSLMADASTGAKFITLNLKPNTEYTMSSDDPCKDNGTITDLFFCNMDESVSSGTNGVKLNKSITRTSDANGQLRVGYRCYEAWITPEQLVAYHTQVEEGTATAFAPYSNICPISGFDSVNIWVQPTHDTTAEPTATIQLGETVYGGTLDVVNGKMTVTWAKIVYNGSETWYPYGTQGYYIRRDDMAKATQYKGILKSDILPTYQSNYGGDFSAAQYGIVGWSNLTSPNQNYIYVKCGEVSATDQTVIKAWLQENPLTVTYELATPFELILTPEQISTLQGTNNVWSDAGDVTVEYRAQ